jgi:hypothetical protein
VVDADQMHVIENDLTRIFENLKDKTNEEILRKFQDQIKFFQTRNKVEKPLIP